MLDLIEYHKQKNGALNRYNFFNKLILEDLILFCNTGKWFYPEEGFEHLKIERQKNLFLYRYLSYNEPKVI